MAVASSFLLTAIEVDPAVRTRPALAPAVPPPAPSPVSTEHFPAPHAMDPAAFPLEVRRIVLDPGHGGVDPGAQTATGVWEKDLTLEVAVRLRGLLLDAGFQVLMTREDDETISLRQRARLANAWKGDLFVSIHFNAARNPRHRGLETYYVGATTDPHLEHIAGAENRGSGYSIADFRRLLEGVYTHVRREESRQLARAVHQKLAASLARSNPAIHDGGIKPAPFLVLVATEMPGILAEASYLTNDEDVRLLSQPSYRAEIASALFRGIRAHADARNTSAIRGAQR